MQTEKKIAQTDAIFSYVHSVNEIADQSDGVIRISLDNKATVKVGAFSRGGYSRQAVKAADHDFDPEMVLKPFGIFLPAYNENYFYFTDGNVTADFMIDALEDLWPTIKARFNPHTIVINADNGPENNSHRSQFMKRLIEFALKNGSIRISQTNLINNYYTLKESSRKSTCARMGPYQARRSTG